VLLKKNTENVDNTSKGMEVVAYQSAQGTYGETLLHLMQLATNHN